MQTSLSFVAHLLMTARGLTKCESLQSIHKEKYHHKFPQQDGLSHIRDIHFLSHSINHGRVPRPSNLYGFSQSCLFDLLLNSLGGIGLNLFFVVHSFVSLSMIFKKKIRTCGYLPFL